MFERFLTNMYKLGARILTSPLIFLYGLIIAVMGTFQYLLDTTLGDGILEWIEEQYDMFCDNFCDRR